VADDDEEDMVLEEEVEGMEDSSIA